MVRALIVRAAGTNCDSELCRAFELCGAVTDLVHVDRLIAEPQRLESADIIGFPGGFSYGDDVASGRIFAMRLRERLYPALRAAAARGCPMIGVCNGFQVLVQVGLLPGSVGGWGSDEPPPQEVALAVNAHGRFTDQWVRVAVDPESPCLWTRTLAETYPGGSSESLRVLRLPVAHGEGRVVPASDSVLARLRAARQLPIRYIDNPNGSTEDIAGICDPTGCILGLMPHPERYLDWVHHPFWTRLDPGVRRSDTPGLSIFRDAVNAARGVRAV